MPTPDEILALPSGARWVKADLHVHTPASADIDEKWKNATPEDVVRIAIDKGLDIIAITDHNTADWCDGVRQAAKDTSLAVLPGVEISTPQGHLLAVFDTDVTSVHIEDLLRIIGFSREQFGDLHAATTLSIPEVAAKVSDFNGVAIAAHADGNRGFLQMIDVGAERKRVYTTPDLWALELLDASTREQHQSGNRYNRRMACIQSSDCWPPGADHHELDGMAYRHTYLKMDELSLSGLKLALIDPDIRVRLAEDEIQSPANVILGMWVTGGFLADQTIRLNENVSCLIGDTGSGKSVATELVRFCLDQPPVVRKIQQEVDSMLTQRLGDLGAVHMLVEKSGSRYLIERTWSSTPTKPIVRKLTAHGLQPIGDVGVRGFFPIKCFSQSEIIEFAREPDVRLSLTDDLIDFSDVFASIETTKADLVQNGAAIISEQEKETTLRAELESRPSLLEDIANIDNILTDPRVTQQQFWYSEQTILSRVTTQYSELEAKLDEPTISLTLSLALPEVVSDLPNQDIVERLQTAYKDWQDYVSNVGTEVHAKFSEFKTEIDSLQQQWAGRFESAESTYRQLLDDLDQDGVGLQALSERRKEKQEQIDVLASKEEQLQEVVLPKIEELNQTREALLNQLQNYRRSITAKRKEKAQQLSSHLNREVVLRVHSNANRSEFEQGLQQISTGAYLQAPDMKALAEKCHPVPLVKRLIAHEFANIAEQSGLEQTKIERLQRTIVDRNRLADLYTLQLTDVDDIIDVQLKLDQQNYRTLEALSHGQKCRVVLMIALAEGDAPLIVDQPEDALHAPSIEEGIVASLRSGRGNRQCLFATRNANILVSADAEQIIALKADAERGYVDSTGSLDRFDHRQLIIYHVEGGEEAFQRRKTMYTLEPSS